MDKPEQIITFSKVLDSALGGGIPTSQVTEVCGKAGSGKTQFCLQLCIDAQIPVALGGLGGEAIYIDTEASFSVRRLEDLAEAAEKHCQKLGEKMNKMSMEEVKHFTASTMLDRVFCHRCMDPNVLSGIVSSSLPPFLSSHPSVKILIVDSIAFPFRYGVDDPLLRTKLLHEIHQTLLRLAHDHNLAVVITNQLTTYMDVVTGRSTEIPALGESFSHLPSLRILLSRSEDSPLRTMAVVKSHCLPEIEVPFQILEAGIRDCAPSLGAATLQAKVFN